MCKQSEKENLKELSTLPEPRTLRNCKHMLLLSSWPVYLSIASFSYIKQIFAKKRESKVSQHYIIEKENIVGTLLCNSIYNMRRRIRKKTHRYHSSPTFCLTFFSHRMLSLLLYTLYFRSLTVDFVSSYVNVFRIIIAYISLTITRIRQSFDRRRCQCRFSNRLKSLHWYAGQHRDHSK